VTPLIRTTSQASIELAEAIRWYESKRRGLGGELLDEVAKTIERLTSNPDAGSPMSADRKTRRLLVSRFPYHQASPAGAHHGTNAGRVQAVLGRAIGIPSEATRPATAPHRLERPVNIQVLVILG